jgi:hypothetical protein
MTERSLPNPCRTRFGSVYRVQVDDRKAREGVKYRMQISSSVKAAPTATSKGT